MFPETARDDAKSLSWEHQFNTIEFDRGIEQHYFVLLRRPLHAVKDPVERAIIVVRALYTILGTSQNQLVVEDAEHPIKLLPDEEENRRDVRHQLLRYITERHDVIFDQPYRVMEFVGAIRCNVASLLRQLEWLDHEKLLMFDLSSLQQSRPRTLEAMLRYRMVLDSDRLREVTHVPSAVDTYKHYKIITIEADKSKNGFIFCMTEFSGDSLRRFSEVIEPLCEPEFAIPAVISKDDHLPYKIDDKVVSHIHKCSLAIADISTRNPNVMYEMGFAHAISKDVVIICDRALKGDKEIFDIRNINTIFFDNDDHLRDELKKKIRAVLNTPGTNRQP